MKNDEAIAIIMQYISPDWEPRYYEAISLAIAALERDRWISVEEHMPFSQFGEGMNVLTADSFGVMRVAYWDGGNWCWPTGECIGTTGIFPITHWRPLPEPPKEET